jgi:hypothetical protein
MTERRKNKDEDKADSLTGMTDRKASAETGLAFVFSTFAKCGQGWGTRISSNAAKDPSRFPGANDRPKGKSDGKNSSGGAVR